MDEDDVRELLTKAREEIRTLRRENQLLLARVETMDLMATILFTKPYRPSISESEDVLWGIDRVVADLTMKAKPP